MEKEWKNTLFAYVNQYNQCEIDFRPQAKESVIADLDVLLERGSRMERLQQWYREREAVPLRCETRARLSKLVLDTPEEACVDVSLYIRLFYEKRGMNHREERMEQERLTFTRDGGQWAVTRIERSVPERGLSAGAYPFEPAETVHAHNLPLLNRKVTGPASRSRNARYRREEAVDYADRWWNSSNPEFEAFEVDCTNYISQCLFAGGGPIHYTGRRESGWWYKGLAAGRELWSYSWAVSNSLQRYLDSSTWGLRAEQVERPEQLALGDVIFYDWDGDGTFQHSTIVTAFDAGGMPLVNAHTVSSRHRYWDYKDSYAWNDATVYRFYHIADQF
ncbi:amidase domain-containing protein [Paenibacillus sp. JX-17]|uniref:Amidase domain-containing protein n=1 Tax=Paenibacillus lacisoli TaxID=3064525 RepID=A0ABT9CJZ1_9BACL|nr:amidase domain-containing protein [Paenibacillus sp. JX-17]MDO7908247.1 amidase domain-containing protein [Paenibacillus sp. JX-17]